MGSEYFDREVVARARNKAADSIPLTAQEAEELGVAFDRACIGMAHLEREVELLREQIEFWKSKCR